MNTEFEPFTPADAKDYTMFELSMALKNARREGEAMLTIEEIAAIIKDGLGDDTIYLIEALK